MSTDSILPTGDASQPVQTRRDFATGPQPSAQGAINQELIQETRDQIRQMVDEISQLAESESNREDFYQGFLTRVTSALASIGGAIWRIDDEGEIRLEYQINMSATGLGEDKDIQLRHHALLQRLANAGEAELVAPQSSDADNQSGNPTPLLLVVGPLMSDQKVVGLVEIFQRPDSGPTTQRGYLRFVIQMCRIASNFLKNDQLRQFSEQQEMWLKMQQFVRAAFASLSLNDTLYAIANEGRRVIDCDRVSVAIPRGGRMHVSVMSGLDTIERRADQVKKLGRLASTVVKGKQPLLYAGDDENLPPQIQEHLHSYLDVAHSKLLLILPLLESRNDESRNNEPKTEKLDSRNTPIIGAIIVEQMSDAQLTPVIRKRSETVCALGSQALTNAKTHSEMFLAPLWTRLGKATAVVKARNLPKSIIVAAILIGIFAALWMVPYPFTLSTNGQLVPEEQHEIFAQVDGVLQEIMIPEETDAIVDKGQLIAVMTNNDLMIEINDLNGQLKQVGERIRKLQRAQHGKMDTIEHRMIEGDLSEAIQSQHSLQQQLIWALQKRDLLQIHSPAEGQVVNWQIRKHLLRRPVVRGQNLMTIVPPDSRWQIELDFPEKRVTHLLQAKEEHEESLQVSFTLASHPGRQYTGKVLRIDRKLEVRGENGNTLLIRVEFDEEQIPEDLLKTGTRVTAKVHAGQRSLGYVWFHELTETIHQTWLMWF